MKNVCCLLLLLILQLVAWAQRTVFEKSGGKQSATYQEIIRWYKALDKSSRLVKLQEMGNTDADYPLHLVLVSGDARFNPVGWHQQKKVVILVNNGIHPGEPDGIDASMMLVRDLSTGKVKLPRNVVLAFIPVYNIGGCLNRNSYTRVNQNGPEAYGFRGNAQNLDLNRDFTKCDSRESRSFASLFHWLEPDVFLDTHVSDGADFQHTMTLITTQYDKLGPVAGPWLKTVFEPAIYQDMKTRSWDMIPYVDFEASDFNKGITMFYDAPRYSSGYAALFNCLSFISETHMLKPFDQRVQSTYDLMCAFIHTASQKAGELLAIRADAKQQQALQTEFPLKWVADSSRYDEITFKGYETDSSLSEATGLQKMYFDHGKPYTKKVHFFNNFIPSFSVKRPKAYVIPHGWHEVADLLALNGVKMEMVMKDSEVLAGVYHIDDYSSYPRPYEKHHKNYGVKLSIHQETTRLAKGDWIVSTNQPAVRFIIEMLEPGGDDSYFSWNFFDAILQQKEGYSAYRWEPLAAEVLRNDPDLKKKLDATKDTDANFSSNSYQILDFIYKNSKYYEPAHLRYPVYRLEQK